MLPSTDVILHPVVCYFRCFHLNVQLYNTPASCLQVWNSARSRRIGNLAVKDINNNNPVRCLVFNTTGNSYVGGNVNKFYSDEFLSNCWHILILS